MVIIRLARHGSKKKPFYKIVVSDKRYARNGRFLEKIGYFNPINTEDKKKIKINILRFNYWIKIGAKISKRVKNIIKLNNKIEK